MNVEWMERYRPLMRALVNHTNSACRFANIRTDVKDGILLNHYDWQVLEYLYEHEENDEHMLHMSKRYHTRTNKKNVILKITDLGKEVYEHHVTTHLKDYFTPMFTVLNELSDTQLDVFVRALDTFNHVDEKNDHDLIPE